MMRLIRYSFAYNTSNIKLLTYGDHDVYYCCLLFSSFEREREREREREIERERLHLYFTALCIRIKMWSRSLRLQSR